MEQTVQRHIAAGPTLGRMRRPTYAARRTGLPGGITLLVEEVRHGRVAFYSEFAEGSPETFSHITERVMQRTGPTRPAGMLYHAEGPLDGGGWWAFDALESEDSAQSFYSEVLTPILQVVGGLDARRRKLAVYFETRSLPPS